MSSTSNKGAVAVDRKLLCSDGIELCAQVWKSPDSTSHTGNVLCVHGWMDNLASFHELAPALAKNNPGLRVATVDLPGHGRTARKGMDSPPSLTTDFVFYLYEAVKQLNWTKFVLVGHSLGASISILYAATFPEHVQALVALDGAGPDVRNTQNVLENLREHIEKRSSGNELLKRQKPRVLPKDLVLQIRCQAAECAPGKQWISKEAAAALVDQGTIPKGDGMVELTGDTRMQWPYLHYFTPEQQDVAYSALKCPICFIAAENGWPFEEDYYPRFREVAKLTVDCTLPGYHHFHADPKTAPAVFEKVNSFLKQEVFKA